MLRFLSFFITLSIIICSIQSVENQCKKIKSGINYLNMCLNEKSDSEKAKFNINSFCTKDVREIFELLKLDS